MSEKIINILRNSEGFVSGQSLSRELGLTRAGVWKQIISLREKGFLIEAQKGVGYRLIDTPDLEEEDLKSLLGDDYNLIYLSETDSTNDYSMTLVSKGILKDTIVVADAQSRGKGRLGRVWLSPPGKNIYMSVIVRPELHPKDSTLITLLSAVCSAHAIRNIIGLDALIKWPNDIIVNSKKIGGILLELRSEPDRIAQAVIGIGINVNSEAEDFPPELSPIATSVFIETGRLYKRTPIIVEIARGLKKYLSDFEPKTLLDEWRALSCTLGKEVLVSTPKETLRGWAEDIDETGRLLLRTEDGSIIPIHSGDLSLLR